MFPSYPSPFGYFLLEPLLVIVVAVMSGPISQEFVVGLAHAVTHGYGVHKT